MPTSSRRALTCWLSAVLLAAAVAAFALIVGGAPASAAPADLADDDDPSPQFVVSVSPDHGTVGSTFQATLTITGMKCHSFDVSFFLDGAVKRGLELAPVVTMPDSCVASSPVTVPATWHAGDRKRILATYLIPIVPSGEQAATFTVDPGAGPAPTGTSTPTAAPTAAPTASPGAGATPSGTPTPGGATSTPAAGAANATPSSTVAAAPGTSAIGSTSPEPSDDARLHGQATAEIGATPPARTSEGLLWAASIGIVVVCLVGGWAVNRRRRNEADEMLRGRHRL